MFIKITKSTVGYAFWPESAGIRRRGAPAMRLLNFSDQQPELSGFCLRIGAAAAVTPAAALAPARPLGAHGFLF